MPSPSAWSFSHLIDRSRPPRPRGHRQLRIKSREGESVTMNCRARGNPTPIITWDFQGLELSDIEPRITYLADRSLQIDDVSVADIGTYKCTARNMYGIIQMRTFTLIVEGEFLHQSCVCSTWLQKLFKLAIWSLFGYNLNGLHVTCNILQDLGLIAIP